jgi:hypothetical protein
MKRIALVLIIALCACLALSAQAAPANPLGVNAYAGIYYNAVPLSGDAFDFFRVLFNLRGGASADILFDLGLDGMSLKVGGELGLQYMSATMTVGTESSSVSLIDIPVLGKAKLDFGWGAVDVFAGMLLQMVLGSGSDPSFGSSLDVGARLLLGPIFAEASYVISLGTGPSFPRIGAGYSFALL